MTNKKYITAVADRVVFGKDSADSLMNIHRFDWVEGVGLYGILRAYEILKEEKYRLFLNDWIEQHKSEAEVLKTVNSTAPMMSLLEFTGEKELPLCRRIADYIIEEAPRLKNGALEHTVTNAGVNFTGQMWADTLFMVCIFLTKLGKMTGESKYTQEAILQLRLHHQYLKDKETGLFFHGYSEVEKTHLSGARWARANAWITAGTVEMLEMFPDKFEGREEILNSLQEQVSAYRKWQREDGRFYTVLDRPDGYPETSATAGIAYGIRRGVRDGYIKKEDLDIAANAERAVIAQIDKNGAVQGVSGGTPIMPTIEDYHTIEVLPTLYGQALTLLMLCETDTNRKEF